MFGTLHLAVKKEGYNVGNSTFGGFGKGRVSGDLELLVITPTTASLKEFCMEHQHGQKEFCMEHQHGQKRGNLR
jgi:hypothetical protein